jgi:hypothetical protein
LTVQLTGERDCSGASVAEKAVSPPENGIYPVTLRSSYPVDNIGDAARKVVDVSMNCWLLLVPTIEALAGIAAPFTFATVGFGYVPLRSPPADPPGAPPLHPVVVNAAAVPFAQMGKVLAGIAASEMVDAPNPDPPIIAPPLRLAPPVTLSVPLELRLADVVRVGRLNAPAIVCGVVRLVDTYPVDVTCT